MRTSSSSSLRNPQTFWAKRKVLQVTLVWHALAIEPAARLGTPETGQEPYGGEGAEDPSSDLRNHVHNIITVVASWGHPVTHFNNFIGTGSPLLV